MKQVTDDFSPIHLAMITASRGMVNGAPMNGLGTVSHMTRPRKKEPQTPFAERLFAAMERAKVTQEDLAKAAGCSQSTIGELYKANSSKFAAQFAAALGVQAQWLATGEGPMLSAEQTLSREAVEIAAALDKMPAKQRAWTLRNIKDILEVSNETFGVIRSDEPFDEAQAPERKRASGL